MAELNIQNVFLIVFISNLIAIAFLIAPWMQYRTHFKGLGLFITGMFILAVSNFSLGLRDVIPDFISIVFSIFLKMTGMVIINTSINLILLKKINKNYYLLYLMPVIIVITQVLFSYFVINLSARITIVSVIIAALSIINCIPVVRSKYFLTPPGMILFAGFITLAIFFTIRSFFSTITLDTNSFLESGDFQLLNIVIWGIATITWPLGVHALIFKELKEIKG